MGFPFFAILVVIFASINMRTALVKKVLGLRDPPNLRDKRALPHEADPTVREWLSDGIPSGQQVGQYFVRLLPFTKWIQHYNIQWFLGDLVAGKSPC
jgi:sodium-independent sulfate anion transporter 11